MTHTVGADPELFMVNNTGDFVSAIDRIGGSKDFPRPIDDEGCAVQEDNVAIEYNIPACDNVESFIHYNRKVLGYLAQHVAHQGLSLRIIPSANFSEDQLADPRAQEFGCEPDFNAWKGGSQNPRPECADKSLRSAGGHIHIGNIDGLDKLLVIKAMDLFVGVGMMKYDTDNKRRMLYGKAGAHRIKSYGVEYRTPSNAWLQSDETIRYVWAQQDRAVAFVRSGSAAEVLSDDSDTAELIHQAINEGNMEAYAELVKLYDL